MVAQNLAVKYQTPEIQQGTVNRIPKATAAIQLDGYPVFAGSKCADTVRSKDHLIFSSRSFSLNEKALDKYIAKLVVAIKGARDSKEQLVLMAHFQTIKDAISESRTYSGTPGGILVDEKNELELIGVPTYARDYQVIYDFRKYLDVVLTYLCGIEYEQLCDRLEKNLCKFQLDYDILSAAIMTDNIYLLRDIPIGVFFGLSDSLDDFFRQGLASRDKCILRIRGESVRLPTKDWNDSELIYFLLGVQVWEVLQYMFEEFIELYNKDLLIPKDCPHHITSKGHSNIVIQCESEIDPVPLSISFRGMRFLVEARCVEKGNYLELLLQR